MFKCLTSEIMIVLQSRVYIFLGVINKQNQFSLHNQHHFIQQGLNYYYVLENFLLAR